MVAPYFEHVIKVDAYAHLAELVDALVLGTSDLGRGGSSPPVGIYFVTWVGVCFFAIIN